MLFSYRRPKYQQLLLIPSFTWLSTIAFLLQLDNVRHSSEICAYRAIKQENILGKNFQEVFSVLWKRILIKLQFSILKTNKEKKKTSFIVKDKRAENTGLKNILLVNRKKKVKQNSALQNRPVIPNRWLLYRQTFKKKSNTFESLPAKICPT